MPVDSLTYKDSNLAKVVRVKVLSDVELDELYESGVNVDFDVPDDEQGSFDPFAALLRLDGYDVDIHTFVPVYRVFEVCAFCIHNFHKLLPQLLEMEAEPFADTITSMYRASILLNPALDMETFRTLYLVEPLGDDLARAAGLLPRLDPSVAAHLGRFRGFEQSDANGVWITEQGNSDPDEMLAMLDENGMQVPFDHEEMAGSNVGTRPEARGEERSPVEFDPHRIKLLRDKLSERVVGQSEAIDAVYAAIRRAAVGFRDDTRPISVLLFAGPTGVGKTLLARVSAEELFNDKAVGRIDCATLSKDSDVNKLLGPPPGYLGYPDVRPPMAMDPMKAAEWDEAEEIKKKDPSILYRETKTMTDGGVLILDEIEKAHHTIQDQFLTIFDEGYMTTSVGNKIDFRNILIVLTSNLGTGQMDSDRRKNVLGFIPQSCDAEAKGTAKDPAYVKRVATEAAKRFFKPEVMGRISRIVPFTDLCHEDLLRVVQLEWDKSTVYVSKKIKADVVLADSLRERIASVSNDAGYGARLVNRLIEVFVNDQLAEIYLDEEEALSSSDSSVIIDWAGDNKSEEIIKIDVNGKIREFNIPKTVVSD